MDRLQLHGASLAATPVGGTEVTFNIASDSRFVATDERGRQSYEEEVTIWSFPETAPDGTVTPGRVTDAAPDGVKLLDLDTLLEDLGAHIFVAADGEDGPQLTGETEWSLPVAARFALDCAEHVLASTSSSSPQIASTLAGVVAAARSWLERSAEADTGLLGRYSRLAMARRLRHQGDLIGDLAFDLAIDAEAAGVDMLDDPNWTAVAATRDAVLAAVEAVRHDSAPHLVQAENTRYEESEGEHEAVSTTFETPWGPFHAGLRRGAVPAWVAATEAAERARQSVGDALGSDGAAAERAWQRDRLLQALRGS